MILSSSYFVFNIITKRKRIRVEKFLYSGWATEKKLRLLPPKCATYTQFFSHAVGFAWTEFSFVI